MAKSPPAVMQRPPRALPAGEPNSGWSYESRVMTPTRMRSVAPTRLSSAS